jgi:hypothetical protein
VTSFEWMMTCVIWLQLCFLGVMVTCIYLAVRCVERKIDCLEEYVVNARADVEEVHESVGLMLRGIQRVGEMRE